MLPAVKKATVAAVTALAIALTPAAPAFAWGKKEQGFVAGLAAALAVTAIVRDQQRRRALPPVYRQPVYQPAYQPTYQQPTYHPQTTSIYRTPAARAFQSYSSTERRLIQRNLANNGYYRGGIDGSFGPGTYSAIAAYARDTGNSDRLASTSGAFAVYDGLIF
jgi:hypothetical protein